MRNEDQLLLLDLPATMTASTYQDRSFSCTFCHRKFSSAQALGGHMNLHRRERARLRTHFPTNLFSDPLSGHRFWAFEQSLLYNKLVFDPSTMTFAPHQELRDHLGSGDLAHGLAVRRLARMRRQVDLQENSMVGGLDLELRLGQSTST
ncbi:uncharacterized protein LOC116256410 [Nymphaea colorata]|nr:uncharacterized protein LOC116256410 [Nymphaea colorata]